MFNKEIFNSDEANQVSVVKIGSIVTIQFVRGEMPTARYHIMGERGEESNEYYPAEHHISVNTPLARAAIGQAVTEDGQELTYTSPNGEHPIRLLSIDNSHINN
jgi:transcription elongation GreA/GreB family factor